MSENLVPEGTLPVPSGEEEPAIVPAESAPGEQALPSAPEPRTTAPPAGEAQARVETQEPDLTEPAPVATGATEAAAPPEQPETAPVSDAGTRKTDMGDVFSEEYTYPRPKRGDIRQGRIIATREEGMMVDLGLKREGLIPLHDLQRVGSDIVEAVSVGDEIPVFIIRPEDDQEGHFIVSWYRARQEQDWLDAQGLYESGEIWEGTVKGYNRGGLIVPYGKIRGFVPASHVTGISRRMGQAGLQARLAEMVGQTLPLKVLEVNRQKRRLILSERTARREWRAQQREKLLNELQEGDHVHGVVSNVCDFGVFVDLGGTDGLVHISELSWRRTKHPSEVVRVGDEVDAYVLRVDRERKRIGLSLRLMEPDPWEMVEENYHVGQLVTGVVTKLTDFGAFASLDDGIEGLIHISELAEVPPRHPSEVITPDSVLPLVIVKIDGRRRRMGLSLKRVSEQDWYDWEEQRRVKVQPKEVQPAQEAEPVEEVEPEEKEPIAAAQPAVEAATEEKEAAVAAQPTEEAAPEEREAIVAARSSAEVSGAAEPSGEPEPEKVEVSLETEPQMVKASEETAPAVSMLPPEEVGEPPVIPEAVSLEPPEDILMEELPPEEMHEPLLTAAAEPIEPPDEILPEEPPPEDDGGSVG